ncbi:MAG TPA: hypothetical protein VGQ52_22265 [Gemmatimonadaceae bacterium]|nr:hypothetical protein [Gemmatimonadaceae bacterium]
MPSNANSMFDAFRKLEDEPKDEKDAQPARQEKKEAEPESGPAVVPPVLRCSDCRTTLYQTYFAMAGRPVCAKCRVPYAKALAFGRGPQTNTRALMWGMGAALGCALVFGLVSMTVPFIRHLLSIGIAYAVAKSVMAATGNLGGRRFQYMAVAMLYAAIGIGSVFPVAMALNDKSVLAAVTQQRENDKTLGQNPLGNSAELVGESDKGADLVLDARRDIGAIADQLEKQVGARRALAAIHVSMTPDQKHAQNLIYRGEVGMGLLMQLAFSPFVGLLTYGVYSGGIGLLLLIFSLHKAWRWTEMQTQLDLSGPHKVGGGPIPCLY